MKESYYRLARIYHPDRANNTEKSAAKDKFQTLHQAYSILVDPEKKKLYDAGELLTLFSKTTIASRWHQYIRTIDSNDIVKARNSYQGSEAEKKDILREIVIGKGSVTHLIHNIPFMRYEDETRIIEIIKNGITSGEIPKILIRKIRK